MLGGGGSHGAFAGTFDSLAGNPGGFGDSPWSGRDELASDAGVNDIGGEPGRGLMDTADNDTADTDTDFDDSSFDDSDSGSDYA